MQYFLLIVKTILAMSLWGCDRETISVPTISDVIGVEDPEKQVDDEQTQQYIKAQNERIEELERQLEGRDDDDPPISDREPTVPKVIAIGKIVFVVNANNHDLHIRDPAGLHLGERNIIGHMQNGIRGRVIGGPKEVSNLIWWEIEWFGGNCEITNRAPCVGWSAEFDVDGTQLLMLEE